MDAKRKGLEILHWVPTFALSMLTMCMKTICVISQQKNTNQIWLDGLLTIKEYQTCWKKVIQLLVYAASVACIVSVVQEYCRRLVLPNISTKCFHILLNLPNKVQLLQTAYQMLPGAHIQQGKSTAKHIGVTCSWSTQPLKRYRAHMGVLGTAHLLRSHLWWFEDDIASHRVWCRKPCIVKLCPLQNLLVIWPLHSNYVNPMPCPWDWDKPEWFRAVLRQFQRGDYKH